MKENETAKNSTEEVVGNDKSKPSNNRKGGRPNKKSSKGRTFDKRAGMKRGTRTNDPTWYFSNAELAKQAAELSFQTFLGMDSLPGVNNKPAAIIGLAVNPAPGNSYYITSANGTEAERIVSQEGVNLMAQRIYTLLSAHSGRSSVYAPQDIATLILYLGSVVEIAEHIRRIFGVAGTYNQRNRTFPLKMIEAMGITTPVDLISNWADYRMKFNIEMSRINQVPMLDNIGYIRKCRDIYQRIYVDSTSSLAATYFMYPYSFWRLDETSYEGGTVLSTTMINSADNPEMSDWLSLLHDMITDLLNSSTFNVIYADLLKLASKVSVPFWFMDIIPENYIVVPTFDRNFLLQVHNAEIVGAPAVFEYHKNTTVNRWITPGNDVYPDPTNNALIYNPGFTASNFTEAAIDHIVDSIDTDDPSVEDNIEMLRYKVARGVLTPISETGLVPYYDCVQMPDHYIVKMKYWMDSNIGAGAYELKTWNKWNDQLDVAQYTARLGHISSCNCAPIINVRLKGTSSQSYDATFGSLNFWTKVNDYYLSRLNRMTFVGLFDFRF